MEQLNEIPQMEPIFELTPEKYTQMVSFAGEIVVAEIADKPYYPEDDPIGQGI